MNTVLSSFTFVEEMCESEATSGKRERIDSFLSVRTSFLDSHVELKDRHSDLVS